MTATIKAPPYSATLALHGGTFRSDPASGAVAVPIYQSTSYQFRDTAEAERLFALRQVGYTYTRTSNPTRDIVERRLAALEGGAGALIVASGVSARLYALLNLAQAGDNIVLSRDIAGADVLAEQLTRFRIEPRWAASPDAEGFLRATDGNTRVYFAETLPLRDLVLFPIRDVARAADRAGIPLIIDNSALPILVRPIESGAAIVIYRTAGPLVGHSTVSPGVLIDAGTFAWTDHAGRFPALTAPDDSYHGEIWTEVAARFKVPLAYLMRARMRLLRDFGDTVSPFDVFMLAQGVETLPLRMRTHTENAFRAAEILKKRTDVGTICYPGVGSLLSFLPTGGISRARRFLDALEMIRPSGEPGSIRSAASLSAESPDGTILLSIGLEHPEDVGSDLKQALDRSAA
ncbi:PLP-dependent transferase [Telmatospirillum siberiense]|uniref:O-acetylhomoserine aminocarboxypropyltransferase n=1 Tax=Telmatospirillum siberiense TaxID=382514 RepID=A0A2N3PVY6_9PROT|nr:PLP-dependent transferase [Telmatospirillum siberiense]PKU24576.1 O-acetylhomoserine aminocarboxypropyltransferase [Telmatospirillum siberiense]